MLLLRRKEGLRVGYVNECLRHAEGPGPRCGELQRVVNITLNRQAVVPDAGRIAEAKAQPELGPKLLFFSGGSALNEIARNLKQYTYNSVHLITPFDSGGSSQVLRNTFDMPAVGDLRSRLMALANEEGSGQPEVYRLFTHRLPKTSSDDLLQAEFSDFLRGTHPLLAHIDDRLRGTILELLHGFTAACPAGFNLVGASIGNLILTGGYLSTGRTLEPALQLMSRLVDVKGRVHAAVDQTLDLAVVLNNGQEIIGQRQMTGKEVPPIASPISDLYLMRHGQRVARETVPLPHSNRSHIQAADLICYAPGSLYSSLFAALLPAGTGQAIADHKGPKLYLPGLGTDPECPGMTLAAKVEALLSVLSADFLAQPAVSDLLSAVLCDPTHVTPQERAEVEDRFCVPCLCVPLVSPDRPDVYAPERVCEALVSLSA